MDSTDILTTEIESVLANRDYVPTWKHENRDSKKVE